MDYRFNSFYQDEMHPFVSAMNHSLDARVYSSGPLTMISRMVLGPSEKLKRDRRFMQAVAMDLIKHRRQSPTEKKDLLNAMLHGKDPKTGQVMRDELVVANMITFLIAGKSLDRLGSPETKSACLSSACRLTMYRA